MIPILFPENESVYGYSQNSRSQFADATSCSVTEELNGAYQLKMTLPRSSPHLANLAVGMQILAAPNPFDQTQPFRISHINKSLRGDVEITALHLVYDLRRIPIGNVSQVCTSASQAAGVFQSEQSSNWNKFTFPSRYAPEPTGSETLEVKGPAYIWDLLGMGEDTLIGAFGGELKFDRRQVNILTRRGEDRGFEILYGVNMTELTYEVDRENLYTAVLPFWKSGSSQRVGSVQYANPTAPSDIASNRDQIMLLDLSEKYSSIPSAATLNAAGREYILDASLNARANYNAPELRVKVTAVPPGSRGLQTLEEVQLGDTIRIKHEGLNVNVKTRVVQTVYDVLRDRYTSFDVEGRVYGVATTIAKIGKQVKTGRVAY